MLLLCWTIPLIPIKEAAAAKPEDKCPSEATMQFDKEMRLLWIEHVIYTRNYINSAVANEADKEVVLARLLKNQKDIGNAVKPFYGEAAGNKLADLLTDHILIAGKIIEAAKASNEAEVKKLNKEWYQNAEDISKFLSKANPNLKEKELKELLFRHLKFVTDEVVARIQKDWEANIKAFDEGRSHILHLADTLSGGIEKQFPDKF